jgi:hypothetical protein
MSDETLSRRNFLAGAGAILGLAVVPAVLSAPSVAKAATPTQLPWPYKHLDPETIGRRAYELYYLQGGCAEATWWPIVEALSTDYPDTWGTLPKKMFAFGGGGVNAWGTLCGTCNGSAAIIKMTGADGSLVDDAFVYYAETPLPTNGIDKAVRAGWAPTAGAAAPLPNVPTSTAHSQLCHASLTQWMVTSGATDGSVQQKDRCAKACYDMAFHTTTLLNAYFDSGAKPVVALDGSVAACETSGCHHTSGLASKTKMACDSCHDEPVDHASVK